ncbi:CG33703 [Drosophila busckii]|uniref:CG33703 n=2 Tax=Drosophila busckii TaxID=30019 RepID=A0A0M4EPJ7_DROBS|nr:CG33703 [Drosophila busckii]
MVSLSLYKLSKTYSLTLINETVDYCAFMKNRITSRVIGYVVNMLAKYASFNYSCPVQQKDIIVAGSYPIQGVLHQIPAPSGNYMFRLQITSLKKWKQDIKVYAFKQK